MKRIYRNPKEKATKLLLRAAKLLLGEEKEWEGFEEIMLWDDFIKIWPIERIISEGSEHGFKFDYFRPGDGWKNVIYYPFTVVFPEGGETDSESSEGVIVALIIEQLGEDETLRLLHEAFPGEEDYWNEFVNSGEWRYWLKLAVGSYRFDTEEARKLLYSDLEDINYHTLNSLVMRSISKKFD